MLSAVPAEQWADEEQVTAPRTEIEAPRIGPVVGAHIGASLGNQAPDVGGRLGARFALTRHLGLSVYVDAQWAQERIAFRCYRWRDCAGAHFTTTLLTGVARLEFITDGRIGPLLVPGFTAAVFVGGGAAFVEAYQLTPSLFEPAKTVPFARVGLHLGMTRLPNGWWFPFFVELGSLCAAEGCTELNFVAGVGL